MTSKGLGQKVGERTSTDVTGNVCLVKCLVMHKKREVVFAFASEIERGPWNHLKEMLGVCPQKRLLMSVTVRKFSMSLSH